MRARAQYNASGCPFKVNVTMPFSAFPSWFMRITCDRCGKMQMVNETHARAGRAC